MLYKAVDGVMVPLSSEEETATIQEWEENKLKYERKLAVIKVLLASPTDKDKLEACYEYVKQIQLSTQVLPKMQICLDKEATAEAMKTQG